jgi:hypothetical protein
MNIPAKIGSNGPSGFWRKRLKCEKFTDNRYKVMTIANMTPLGQMS